MSFRVCARGDSSLPALPGTASAQVYPERIVAMKARAAAVTRAYQGRSRDDNREEQTERTTKVAQAWRPTARSRSATSPATSP